MASRKRKLSTEAGAEIEGLSELFDNLKRLEDVTTDKVLNKSLMAAAKPIEEEAARLTPRSETPGGTMGKGHGADHIKSVVQPVTRSGKREVFIGPEADFWYLVFPEFGTPHQPARAMFRTAADTRFGDAVKEFRDAMSKGIKQAVRHKATRARRLGFGAFAAGG